MGDSAGHMDSRPRTFAVLRGGRLWEAKAGVPEGRKEPWAKAARLQASRTLPASWTLPGKAPPGSDH